MWLKGMWLNKTEPKKKETLSSTKKLRGDANFTASTGWLAGRKRL